MQYRVACVSAIYAKSLRLPANSSISNGLVMNLASNDVERFIMTTLFISHLFWGPLESIAVLIVGVNILGRAFAFGYLLLAILIMTQFHLSKKYATYRHKIALITDQRVNLLSQAFSGVRVMKMSAWEPSFDKRIRSVRQREMTELQHAHRLKAINEGIFFCCNIVITTFVLVIHVTQYNGELSPGSVFSTISLFSLVQFTMGKFFGFGVM